MALSNRGKSTDNVNHPSHYTQGYCETIYEIYDILGPEGFKSYCLGNWIKYKSRAQYKNGDEDLKKAEVYLGWATNGLSPLDVKNKLLREVSDFLIGDIVAFQFLENEAPITGEIKAIHLSGNGTLWMADVVSATGSHYCVPLYRLKKKIKCDGNHSEPACSDPKCWCR